MPKRNKKNFRPTEKGAGMTRAGVAVETYIIKMTEWCWQTRVKLLKKKRRKK